jgi:hypothetical protein
MEVLNIELLLLTSLISDYGAFLWSSLEQLKTIRYFNQNTMAHGGKCGFYVQGCELMVSAAIYYFIALFHDPHVVWKCIVFNLKVWLLQIIWSSLSSTAKVQK